MSWLVALGIIAVAVLIYIRKPLAGGTREVKMPTPPCQSQAPLPDYDLEAAQRELTGNPPLICRALHRCGVVLVGLLLASLLGCVVNFDAEPLHAPIAPGVNRLDHSDMELYRDVWGDRLREHKFRARPEPQKLTINGRGDPWLFVSTWQERKP